jgi:hypothetical protein
MAAERIGRARCPLCRAGGASVSLTKKGLTCMTCNSCNTQLFARSGRSDELLRACIVPDAAAEPAQAVAVAPKAPLPGNPTPTPQKAIPTAAERQHMKTDLERAVGLQPKKGFGLLGSW